MDTMKQSLFLIILLLAFGYGKAQITSAEYFIDTDPGVGNGIALTVTGNVIDSDFSIPTIGLSAGIHKLYIRVENADGNWSLYDKNVFYILPDNTNNTNITGAEYFIDTDPGVGNGTALSVSGNIVDMDFDIPTSGLPDGIHKLCIRLINEDNTWSLYDCNVFYVSENNSNTALITSAEYFFDIDPGLGNGAPIDLDNTEDLNEDLTIDVPVDLPDGDHFLYVRVQNTDGTWSLYTISEMLSSLSNNDFELQGFKFYPNPVKDILYFDLNNQAITEVKIIDLLGQVVFQSNASSNHIDLRNLGSGTYLMHLKTDKARISKKIIKQ